MLPMLIMAVSVMGPILKHWCHHDPIARCAYWYQISDGTLPRCAADVPGGVPGWLGDGGRGAARAVAARGDGAGQGARVGARTAAVRAAAGGHGGGPRPRRRGR